MPNTRPAPLPITGYARCGMKTCPSPLLCLSLQASASLFRTRICLVILTPLVKLVILLALETILVFVLVSFPPHLCSLLGYRSIALKNVYNEPLELSSLLVHLEYSFQPASDEYQSLQELRSQLRREQRRRDELVHEMAKTGVVADTVR